MTATNIVLAELLAAELEKNAALEDAIKKLQHQIEQNKKIKSELSECCQSLVSKLVVRKRKVEELVDENKKLKSEIAESKKLAKHYKILADAFQLDLQDEKQRMEMMRGVLGDD